MYYIYIFSGIWLFKFLNNTIHFVNNWRLNKIWQSYFKNSNKNALSYKPTIIKNFKDANLIDTKIPITIPTGYFMVANTKYSVFENMYVYDEQIIYHIKQYFNSAKGIYRSRIVECFNPFYWIRCIVFLPKTIIQFLGLNVETIFTKILQIIFWIIDSVLLVVYQQEITNFIKNLFI